MIPVKLREQMELVPGREYVFSTLEKDGHRFICIDCGLIQDELSKAIQIVQENGMQVINGW
jgi:hypothetical protein